MEYVKLEEICTIVSGGTPSRSKPNYWNNGNIPWIKIKDMKSKYIDSAEEFITEEGLNNSSTKMLKRDTILYSIFATLGEVGILKIDACTNQAIAGLSLKEDSNILKEYLYYYLKSKKKDVNNLGRGVAQNNINLSLLRKFKIPVIPLRQQKKIIEVLDNVSSTINNYERELTLLDELVKARFVEMFGDPVENTMNWPEIFIGDKCFVTKLAGFEYTQYIDYEESGEVVMVKAQNVKNGKLNRKDLSFISKKVSDSLPRSQLAPGDVVMTYVGANIGDVAVIDDVYKYHLAPNVAKIRPNAEVYNSIYFMYMLMLLNIYIVKNSADTAKAALGMERIRKLKVFIPPLELQNQFASFVEEIDKSRLLSNHSLFLIKSITF